MMKKVLLYGLTLVMVLALAGCGSKDAVTNSSPNSTPSESQDATPTGKEDDFSADDDSAEVSPEKTYVAQTHHTFCAGEGLLNVRVAITEDGSVWVWSKASYADGFDAYVTPSKVMDDAIAVCGQYVIKSDNSLWKWITDTAILYEDVAKTAGITTTPVKVMDDVAAVSDGTVHTLAIKTDGSLWAWGSNAIYGALGDGTAENRTEPIKVMDNVISASVGDGHSLAVQADGSLWAWGRNDYGQLGNDSTESSFSPVKIMDDVAVVEAGQAHSFAIKNDGTLWAWGRSMSGALGDGTYTEWHTPVRVMDDVIAVSAHGLNYGHSHAITSDGTLWGWGYNGYGSVGDGSTEDRTTPVKVMDDVIAVSAGNYMLAMKSDGTLWGWGDTMLNRCNDSAIIVECGTPMQINDGIMRD